MRKLVFLVEHRRQLVNDKTRLTNRLNSALKQYYPLALDWFDRKDTIVCCNFLERWPTLAKVKRARPATLRRFFREHKLRFEHVIERRISSLKLHQPLTEDDAVISAFSLQVVTLAAQIRTALQALKTYDDEIAALADSMPGRHIIASFPGTGPHLTPRLIVAMGEQRDRFANAAELQRYAGVAPVTERSGQKTWVHWRWASPVFLRQTFVEWAGQTVNKSVWAGAYYRQQRQKGSSHQTAIRALAYKWIRIIYRCWQTNTPYDEGKYLLALQRRGSPLIGQLAGATSA